MAVTLGACGSGHPSTQRTTTTAQQSTTATTSSIIPLAARAASQLRGQLRGIQGAAGNWGAAIWIADTSSAPCALRSPVEIELLNSSGAAQLHTSATFAALPLSANTPFPPPTSNPGPEQELASFVLSWPTDTDAALQMGSTSGICPMPDFIPTTLRLVFGNGASIDIPNETKGGPTGMSHVDVCGSEITVTSSSSV